MADVFAQIVVNGLLIGMLLALAAVGLSLVFGVMGVVNIAHGEFIMLAGYLTYWGFVLYGLNPLVSLAISIPAGALVGYLFYRLLIAALMERESLANDSLLITFGVSVVLINLARVFWRTDIRAYQFLTGSYEAAGFVFPRTQVVAGIIALVIYGLMYGLLNYTRIGKAIRATAQNRGQAKRVGINVDRIDGVTFALASALGAASGTLLSMVFTMTPRTGFEYVLDSFVIITLGGLGSFVGALVGALLFSVVNSVGGLVFDQTTGHLIALSLIFVVLSVRPHGLFGRPGGEDE